jgi:hypothetical protein
LKYTDIPKVLAVSIVRAMMEAVRTSEMSVYCNETTLRYIPEDCHLHSAKVFENRIIIKTYLYVRKRR